MKVPGNCRAFRCSGVAPRGERTVPSGISTPTGTSTSLKASFLELAKQELGIETCRR
jgi:hypothetical protein